MQTRLVVHRAYNKAGVVCLAVEVAGRLIGFKSPVPTDAWPTRSASAWAKMPFNYTASLQKWKQRARRHYHAHRFERVTLLGETTCKHV